MEKLPQELLDLIFKELPLRDRLSLAYSASFLRDAFKYSCGNDFNQITYSGPLREYWPSIFQMCGSYIKEIVVNSFEPYEYELVENNCPNLQAINLSGLKEEHFTLFMSMVHGTKNLRSINLSQIENTLPDKITHALRGLPNLKVLALSVGNYSTSNKNFFNLANLRTFANLEELTIRAYGFKLSINEILNSLKRLSRLELGFVDIDSTTGEVGKCSYLKVLKLQAFKINNALPLCPRLRHLSLIDPTSYFNRKLLKWFGTHSKTLESLEVDDDVLHLWRTWHSNEITEFPALKSMVFCGQGTSKLPSCPKIQFFTLKYLPISIFVDWISRHSETLKSLDLPERTFLESESMPYLPKLRSVCLRPAARELCLASKWLFKQSKTLYSLEIHGNFDVIHVCQLISGCTKVRVLTISWHMDLYEASWIRFFETLKDNKVALDEPLIVTFKLMHYIDENVKWLFMQKLAKYPNFELCKFKFLAN